ncbi:acetate kinase [Candidatus Tachikawaea gelatinosa]|uniref:Acetate kinase n=1 Tax=Candidatus Tachikawaea gelatinosa TaxID=1410383 RepID=A0A090APV7_9ENTR|nr:acetate kinase [Candidatus Tachikawaea gelatinosa]BAP58312.1 acetate kinase [Candidatus Tachikawaea gelatinosa]
MINKYTLVLNCGSSSIKFAIFNIENEEKILWGLAECLYLQEAQIKWHSNNIEKKIFFKHKATHIEVMDVIINTILKNNLKIYKNIIAIGHRVVHGGEKITHSTVITKKVIETIKESIHLAPLHNPAHLIGIKSAIKNFPQLSQRNIAVFDTAFHQTIPEHSFLYALPYKLYKKHGIRRYGAHGISHQYVTYQAASILNKSLKNLNIITCHLGNGCSIAAICNGKCVDTSMGFTSLEGLVMGTRSGDIDPAIIFFLYNQLNMKIDDIKELLTKKSGLFGLSEITSDCRYIEKNYKKDIASQRAINVFCHRLSKYIASYIPLMNNHLDGLIFTGGIGENSSLIRQLTIEKLSLLNFNIDNVLNSIIKHGKSGSINTINTRPILIIPTNEELMIAKDTISLINKI